MQSNDKSSTPADDVEVMITTDIDFTADLDDQAPVITATTFTRSRVATSPPQALTQPSPDSATPTAEPRLPVAPGRVLCDRYVLTQLIGTGGTCTVFRARDLEASQASGKPTFVAVKTPRPDAKNPARAIERLQREFEHARRLSHSGIVQVHELGCDGDVWFMTMEMLEGESLATIMRRQATPVAAYLTRRVLRGMGDALAYAHASGIAHGDLNPANVFVAKSERVKLIDFATACHSDQRAGDQRPAAAATLAYASPQVLAGEAPSVRDDVFSFGCIAFELFTGRHPFGHRPANLACAEGLRPEVPTNLTSEQSLALMAALSWEHDARPEDIKALAVALSPDPPRRRTVEPEIAFEPPPVTHYGEKRWWLLGAVSLLTMIAAVVGTRML